MEVKNFINTIKQWLRPKSHAAEDLTELPIQAELFSADQMERYATTLALSHTLVKKRVPDKLLTELTHSETILIKSCKALNNSTVESFSPAREWLLDNFYLIQEQINAIRRDLPKGYGKSLPQLANVKPGYPRVYDIALEIIEHGDGRWDLENLNRFITAYQSVTPLTLGELWAIPIMLGIALIENLSKASQRIVADRIDRQLADHWADSMIEAAVTEPRKLVIIVAEMARAEPPMSCAYVAELARRLQSAALPLPLNWVEQHLAEEGLTIEQMVQDENKHQAASQLTVSNGIDSLRRLGEVDWRDLVEAMSVVEHTLRTDPTDTYSKMDFDTRDHYRHMVERLSRASKRSENDVAASAIQLAKAKKDELASSNININSENERYCHVGYYLIDKGLLQLERTIQSHVSIWKKISRFTRKNALFCYISSTLLIIGIILYPLLLKASQSNINTAWLVVLGVMLAIAVSQLATGLVNLVASLLITPLPLPRMDFSKNIPPQFRTFVVVPTMLSNAAEIELLVEALEVRYLGNRNNNLHFMLLTDFNDAPKEHMPEDIALLSLAHERIATLNERYSTKDNDIFFLLARPRKWSANENIWMGNERKRGKLVDLNNLLYSNNQKDFILVVGRTDIFSSIKYVITLDTDTQLPRESAQQYIATMAHPLNRPIFDAAKNRVIGGYGILQPRIAEGLSLNGPNRYVRLCGNEFGIDPYTRTVSDVYQDLFHEGSFIGKGIYDATLFQQVLGDRFPDNRILSHDLLEGCYLRSGFLSDVPLYEATPTNYLTDVKRRIRWIRGDWQIAGWLFPKILNKDNQRVANPISTLSKLKILDNLRRSLVPIALLVLFFLSWTILPISCFWFDLIIAIVVLPTIIATLLACLRKPLDMLSNQRMAPIIHNGYHCTGQLILYLACLPNEAWYTLNAILRTCWRLLISKRHLLEWVPYNPTDHSTSDKLIAWIFCMWMGPVAAIIVTLILVINHSYTSLMCAAPLLALWCSSPIITHWLSQPFQRVEPVLDAVQIRFLHKLARKTWDFFDTFVTEENHWLPPDNYQEIPVDVLARRTSPTNIGLALLANLTAYDFGYININQLLTRTANTLQTMTTLERYHGHLLNWYSTETLAPLIPRYVSTVDSGNLAGHLLTLRQGLLTLANEPLLNIRYLDGLRDTYRVLASKIIQPRPLVLTQFKQLLRNSRLKFNNWQSAVICCNELVIAAKKLTAMPEPTDKKSATSIAKWSAKLLQECQALQDEINLFAAIPQIAVSATLRDIANLQQNSIPQINHAKDRIELIDKLTKQAFSLAQMDVSFLYDDANHLMTIGFNVDSQQRDTSDYDLLASEARLAIFVNIAQGQALQESWFALGRLMTVNDGEPTLISWSGSMFEYLMPLLVMPTYPGTLLDQTYHAAVRRQIAYGKQCKRPWGISESGYFAFDNQLNYLYRAFGVPGLGLKRGLADDMVIAPYACAMALMVAPELACQNLQRLEKEKALGQYGFYEAIDFTPSRLPRDKEKALVRSFMSHHQGMSLLSISYLLHNQPMQQRFAADPLFQATLLLLQERIPKNASNYLKIPKSPNGVAAAHRPEATTRSFSTPNTRTPQVQLLSNGAYHTVLTQAGSGYSRWKDVQVTRWREDSTCDDYGLFAYVRDIKTGEFWSTIYQPTLGAVENYKAEFTESHANFSRNDKLLDLHTEIVVSPEDDIELRRVRIHNRAKYRRTIEFTSYSEIVLTAQAADLAQPSFSNLFIETELLPEKHAILATRRPLDEQQISPWMLHLLNVYSDQTVAVSFETDRVRFIGRDRNLTAPIAMLEHGDLSNTQGAVLDPIVAIRARVTLEPDALVIFDLLTGMTDTHDHCLALVDKYQDRNLANRIFGLAWTHGQVLLHHLNISEENAQLYGKLASAIIYASKTRRADPAILTTNRRGQSNLWSYSISGDLPIILLQIEDGSNIDLVQQLVQAQAYWKRKGLLVDLVILNAEHISYRQSLQDQIMSLISGSMATDHASNIIVRQTEQMPPEDVILLQSVARVILSDKWGTLKEQLSYRHTNPPLMPLLSVTKSPRHAINNEPSTLPVDLQFFNGLGGYTGSGDEYLIRLIKGNPTPAPWANVLANPQFGTLVSESGQAYTWFENAHEFRLTPWDNDPLKDSAGEAYYLRDDETGLVWSPTALPCPGNGDYQTRHGFGYSVFEHIEDGVHTELCMYVARDAAVKFVSIKIRNDSERERRLSVTGYVAWVLGDLRTKNAFHVQTQLSSSGALLAQNHYNTDFSERTAFFDAATAHMELTARTVTGDRTEFIGRNGTLQQPAALKRKRLSGRVGAGLDPCAAIQLAFNLEAGQSREIIFTLGAGFNKDNAETLSQQYCGMTAAKTALDATRQYWQQTLNTIQVTTPDPAVNLLANGWLLYQVISCRLWARTGYYQSSGAFGFRDQLQDTLSLTHIAPTLLRAQLLLCAAHQFEEGDVQHWWHPPFNRGVRTRCSDDYLWLPFAICHYIETTGDLAVLDENIPFLVGRPLKPDEESYYEQPTIGNTAVSLYQHAVRAINHGLTFGEHGLPLIGSGDWNDGMNMVGIKGKGESVWLGFFLYSTLKQFAKLANRYSDNAFAVRCEQESKTLQQQIEAHGWDGEWYRRAYFDDGTPLGSASNSECKIDSIAQSWSVISGAAEPTRSKQAMASLYSHLVDESANIVKLLTPPFDKFQPNPGYIEGYVPGIRENGGQYTHAAAWAAIAFAQLGDGERAWQLLSMLNPINHGRNAELINCYKIEPYVLAGDVYSVAPHVGRGGWSWYTGSAGWLYRLITETLLGIVLEEGKQLRLTPHLPKDWDSFSLNYRHGEKTVYNIVVKRASEQEDEILLDGKKLNESIIPLQDDAQLHHVILNLRVIQ